MDFTPLAERFRPKDFDGIVGQAHLTGSSGFITRMVQQKKPVSILLFGPPGSGKTSIAKLYAKAFDMRFVTLSAVKDGIGELKKLMQEANDTPLFGKSILLFVDEIHRFNKAQQDAFLPYVENGKVILVGATAENPSFYLNPALLSRMRVLQLNPLDDQSLHLILERYEKSTKTLPVTEDSRKMLIQMAQGDGRYLLNLLENLEHLPSTPLLNVEEISELLQSRAQTYDRAGENHYNLISALHKSVRGSDPDASLYWFTRMLAGGEAPLFIARRLIRMASEDIGLADPEALKLTIAAREAYQALGSPEGELALAEAVVYLALAPKSNAIYTAYGEAKALAEKTGNLPPPKTILNAPTQLMKELDYGKGYRYDHEETDAFSGQNYFPDKVERQSFYHPVERGFEREMLKRIEYFNRLRKEKE
jgi:putative ATPase